MLMEIERCLVMSQWNTSCSLYRKASECLSVLDSVGVSVDPGRRITPEKKSRDEGKIMT